MSDAGDIGDDREMMMWTPSADVDRRTNSSTPAQINLEQLLGPRRFELYKVVPITVIYAIIFFTGVIGNVCTAVVIVYNKYMHTATNYYLCNLVLSDLLVIALGLPVETYSFWSAYQTQPVDFCNQTVYVMSWLRSWCELCAGCDCVSNCISMLSKS